MNVIFDIYYIYLYVTLSIYIKSLLYIILFNTGNILYIYKYRMYYTDSSIITAVHYEEGSGRGRTPYNPGDIILTDDDDSSSSGSSGSNEDIIIDVDTDQVPVNDGDAPANAPSTVTKSKEDCVICFANFNRKTTITTKCGHVFHKTCLVKWLIIDNVCPICREESPIS